MRQTTTCHRIYKSSTAPVNKRSNAAVTNGICRLGRIFGVILILIGARRDHIIAIIRNASNKNANAGVDALLHEVIEIGTRRKQNIPIQEGGRNELPRTDFEQQTFSITN